MRVLLFTGKGGVGKTTLAAATAAHLARSGRKVLVVSTDPAHSLADVLDAPVGPEPSEVDGESGVSASHVDSRGLVDDAWGDLRRHLRTVLAGAGVDELDAEELTVLPGVEELLALAEVERLARGGPWDTVVVDCAPTAETLRLLALPEAFATYLERLFPTHRRVVRGLLAGLAGGVAEQWDAVADALGRLARRLAELRDLLTDQDTTSVRLVLTPERVVAAETRRTLTALALQGVRVDGLVVNRVLPDLGGEDSPAARWLRTRRAEQEGVLAELRGAVELAGLGDAPVRVVEHRAAEPVGLPALAELADQLYGGDDPLAGPGGRPLVSVSGGGRDLDSEFHLRLAVPLAADTAVDLARVGDDLAVTVDGRRRLVALPSVLRRCVVSDAVADDHGLLVSFRPDPRLWMR
ncbi:ArsA family ATPase [Streptoalloteichus tenebrarius]|uniref:ArsA family ATPase n=1 Tax=Streptoalloteichus tenebrarius (strain ATCC 17920 / DSM 40477 / JCM 4838 / CBS 697.72 / NBRC 16177 / NCIMB 11028 / NRRL B-12390 / A12253. 1 / ISP 5477) TaxID=1933 RepID=UPI0020A254DF|nr:ArsA family ATPase [Streptoalloteichus tenebrarius]